MVTPNKKLYRSADNRIIAGVCGGLGEYFNIDPTFIRIIFILLVLTDGVGLVLYFVLALIIPKKGGSDLRGNAAELAGRAKELSANFQQSRHGKNYLGIIIVFLGLLLLLKNTLPNHLLWFRQELIWPALIIIIGFYLMFKKKNAQYDHKKTKLKK